MKRKLLLDIVDDVNLRGVRIKPKNRVRNDDAGEEVDSGHPMGSEEDIDYGMMGDECPSERYIQKE